MSTPHPSDPNAHSDDDAPPVDAEETRTVFGLPGQGRDLAETAPQPTTASETSQEDLDHILETCLDRLVEIAPVDSPVQLSELLPDANDSVSRFVLVELIKMDMAIACEQTTTPESPPTIENYLDAFTHLLPKSEVPVDLVMEELQLRKEIGAKVEAEDYQRRFPEHRSVIGQLLGVAEATAAVQNRRGPPDVEIGSQVDDFLIIQTLGSGAFANVYLARQVSMHRLVALKVSRGTGDEPQALAQLDHPNIVRVFDQRDLDDGQIHLLYMQYLPGGTLADVVKLIKGTPCEVLDGSLLLDTVDRRLLQAAQVVPERSSVRQWLADAPWPMVVAWIGVQLARALGDAHGRGVLHRDVKPANVLLSAEAIPKLADFNVSFAGSAGRAGAAASFGGSIGYMSPEHLRAISATALSEPEQVAERADLYSLAILLWELWQGHRPFDKPDAPNSWSQAVEQQLAARQQPLPEPRRCGGASERVLEAALEKALRPDPDDRPASGAEMAGRLKLALYPDAARLFDPEPASWQGWLMRRSPWLIAGLIILVPNAIAGVYGFIYNYKDTLEGLYQVDTELRGRFMLLSGCINLVMFPLALVVVLWLTSKVVDSLKKAESGKTPSDLQIRECLRLARLSAVIGGALWCLAAVLYPMILRWLTPLFTPREFSHFFLSHVICGGVAAIYPFFGMMVYATTVLYPKLVRVSMNDDRFDERVKDMVRRSERMLLLACVVPLMGIALSVVSGNNSRHVMLVAVLATVAGVFAAFYAYRLIIHYWTEMGKVISSRGSTMVPDGSVDE